MPEWRDEPPEEVQAMQKFTVAVDLLHEEVARLRGEVSHLTRVLDAMQRMGRERLEAEHGDARS